MDICRLVHLVMNTMSACFGTMSSQDVYTVRAIATNSMHCDTFEHGEVQFGVPSICRKAP
jgi:hypothetical protein